MTSILARWKDRLAHWREWELNPVVVKELRQAVRSWSMTGTLLMLLVILFCASLVFLVGQSFVLNENRQLGGDIFRTFLVILTGTTLLFIPMYVGVRLAAERQESNLDLLYITTLTPERIIRGKFLCGAYITVLFFSACMPFMAFTNLLRGVDLPTIFFILICLFLVVCAAIQVAIFFACLPISKLFKILLGLFVGMGVFPASITLVGFFFEMLRSGIGSAMGGRDFWLIFLTVCAVILAAVILLYYLSVALITPMSANRALPLRVYITVAWVLGGVLSFAWSWGQREMRLMLPWTIVSYIILAACVPVVVSNHDRLSYRVRRQIPENPTRRVPAFLFYNGAAGGLVWVGLLMFMTYFASTFLLRWGGGARRFSTMSTSNIEEFELTSGALLFYWLAYALTALLIHRRLFGRRPPRIAGVLSIMLPGAWALIPTILFFFLNRLSVHTFEQVQLGSIANVFLMRDDSQRQSHLICAIIWFALMVVLNFGWFRRQVKDFRPLDPQPPIIANLPPISSTAT